MTDPALLKDLFTRGRRLAMEGRLHDAETVLREALRLARGQGGAAESRACGNLGTFYGIHARYFEALLLYRRALAIDRAREDWRLVALHLANLGTTYAALGLSDRLSGVLRDIDDALERLGEDHPQHAETAEAAHFVRFEAASWLGDREGTRALLGRILDSTRSQEDPRVQGMVRILEATVHREDGRSEAALGAIQEGLALAGLPVSVELDLLAERVRTLASAGDLEGVREAAGAAIARLIQAGDDPHLNEHAISCGSFLAGELEAAGGPADAVRRAYDVASTAALERIRQLDACMRDVPELGAATPGDHAWFAEVRDEFAHQQTALLGKVASVLENARRAGDSPLHTAADEDGMIRLCAWCCTVQTREGRWIPVAHFIPSEPNTRVTHSICPPCAERLRSSSL